MNGGHDEEIDNSEDEEEEEEDEDSESSSGSDKEAERPAQSEQLKMDHLTVNGPESKSDLAASSTTPRLLIISSKIKNTSVITAAVRPNVTFVTYKYESTTLESCHAAILSQLASRKVESVAFVLHSSPSIIHLTGKDDKNLSKDTVHTNHLVQEFFKSVVSDFMVDRGEGHNDTARIDILACSAVATEESESITKSLQDITGVLITISRDIMGSDIKVNHRPDEPAKIVSIGELYFRPGKIRTWSGHGQSLSGFEKIRTVGKGAYGTAVLYRKKDDDSLVILKEINLHDLNVSERQMAQNEVRVLAMLDHPNVIGYYDSFEEDGLLMIEMEYADGGTLAQYLAAQEKPLEEKEILEKFMQIVLAIKCIHMHNILHRDLKTANIFLTKEGAVKVGDFGISKLMSTANCGANTVLGTPYYISPEMCEGKPYNDKSDVWALGCILYETACLQKTFDGSNLPALVNKIMKGQFAPVRGNYSQELKTLIMDMLQKNPEDRPSTAEICDVRLPELMRRYEESSSEGEDDSALSNSEATAAAKPRKTRRSRSVLYYFQMATQEISPVVMPNKIKIRDVAVGTDHCIVVSMEQMVYSWGSGAKGQLGHGNCERKNKPEMIEALKGKSVIRAWCGDMFSVFSSDNGIVMTCGDGSNGCLGHGDWLDTFRPRLIEALLSVDVTAVATGPQHVVAVGSEGEVFTWGRGANGRLGRGTDDNCCQPLEVIFSEERLVVRDCRCGKDGTMLITDVRSVLACGNNEENKLGLNQRQGFLMSMKNMFTKGEVSEVKTFTVVKALARHRVVDISMGPHHTCVIVEPGHVFTLGRNTEGQLGTGNTRLQTGPTAVKLFEQIAAFKAVCGEYFTVAGTTENDLLIWGLRPKPPTPLEEEGVRVGHAVVEGGGGGGAMEKSSSLPVIEVAETEPVVSNPKHIKQHIRQSSTSSVSSMKDSGDAAGARSNKEKGGEKDANSNMEIVTNPVLLLRLDSSGAHSNGGAAPPGGEPPLTVCLANIIGHGNNLFLHVETTAPLPKGRARRRRHSRRRMAAEAVVEGRTLSMSSREGGDEFSSSEHDKSKTLPTWLKRELVESAPTLKTGRASIHSLGKTSTNLAQELRACVQQQQQQQDQDPHGDGAEQGAGGIEEDRNPKNLGLSGVEEDDGEGGKMVLVDQGGLSPAPVDLASSSGSSDAAAVQIQDTNKNTAVLANRKPLSAGSEQPKRITVASVYKSRPVVGPAQKPLTRIRALGQTKRFGGAAVPVSRPREADGKFDPKRVVLLQSQLDAMKEDRAKLEEKLKLVSDEQRQQQELLRNITDTKASEREAVLREEIENLRKELREQSSQLKTNHNVVHELQEQLNQVQLNQNNSSIKNGGSRSPRPQANGANKSSDLQSIPQKESRVCVVQ